MNQISMQSLHKIGGDQANDNNSERQYIIVGCGMYASELYLNSGCNNNLFAYCYDSYMKEEYFHGIKRIDFDTLAYIWKDYRVIITARNYGAKYELADRLHDEGIEFEMYEHPYDVPLSTLHIYGKYPDIKYISNIETSPERMDSKYDRCKPIIDMFQTMFNYDGFKKQFVGKEYDIWINLSDWPEAALKLRLGKNVEYAFAFCTAYSYKNEIIPIPDYRTWFDDAKYPFPETFNRLKDLSKKSYIDNRAFFIGTLASNPIREMLAYMSKNGDYRLCVYGRDLYRNEEGNDGINKFIPMTEFYRYKYLIDVPGRSWADRTKLLLQMGRVVLYIDRPYYEWYFQELEPMRHYVPVKQDLSDLDEKIDYLEEHPEVYNYIASEARRKCDELLSSGSVLQYLKSITLQYGIRGSV